MDAVTADGLFPDKPAGFTAIQADGAKTVSTEGELGHGPSATAGVGYRDWDESLIVAEALTLLTRRWERLEAGGALALVPDSTELKVCCLLKKLCSS